MEHQIPAHPEAEYEKWRWFRNGDHTYPIEKGNAGNILQQQRGRSRSVRTECKSSLLERHRFHLGRSFVPRHCEFKRLSTTHYLHRQVAEPEKPGRYSAWYFLWLGRLN